MPEQDIATVKRLRAALQFVGELAREELQYATVGTGAEVALRHILRKVTDALHG